VGIIKKLASQTIVYGISSMLGRFINFLLIIPHTKYLDSVNDYGDITTIFAFMAFFNIILTYGMETTFFNFIRNGKSSELVFSMTQKSLLFTTSIFILFILLFPSFSSNFIGYPHHKEYIYICLIFLVFDTLSVLPYARIRFEEKPLKFALIKLVNIIINVSLNLYLLIYTPDFLKGFDQVSLILIAVAVASLGSFILLSPLAFDIFKPFDFNLFKQMLKYAWPLIFVGFAGMINETLDRTLLKKLLPASEGSYQNGIYGAFYKLTMIMTMFVQAFRFAAEPLFFKQKESAENRLVYAHVMYWFIGVCTFIFLGCMFFIDELSHLFIRNPSFFKDPNGLYIVPILLLANMFLGIYYNLSIWYRFTNNTKRGAAMSILGAITTVILNIIFIPQFGFVACAWITLAVYAGMCVMSYVWGNLYYSIPYTLKKYLILIGVSILLWSVSLFSVSHFSVKWIQIVINGSLLSLMLLIIWLLQPKRKIA
jgi:O-antigen/teichoic acid export membrane protein